LHGKPGCFNPLHCGAVVASDAARGIRARQRQFQSPSLRGSGRFRKEAADRERAQEVSIPFIAGQWSLLHALRLSLAWGVKFQSPSLRGSGRFDREPTRVAREAPSFNPLHCGAVVASARAAGSRASRREEVSIPFIAGQWSLQRAQITRCDDGQHVSIPFIAGQWSLHIPNVLGLGQTYWFQSPSLRGSGRFRLEPSRYWTTP